METIAFTSLSPGRLAPTIGGAVAFVPQPAPRRLALDAATVVLLARAQHQLGVLSGAAGQLVNPLLIGAPLLRQEAILSSRIEGTIATPEQLVLSELGAEPQPPDARDVQNFVRAMQHALDAVRRGEPIASRLLLGAHGTLMAGARGAGERPGEFRDAQNFIGTTADIRSARFVPPPHTELASLLSDFETFVNVDAPELPHLVRAAIAHYQFETIHPFRDGNGRIGRLLVLLMLVRDGLVPGPIVPISSFLERHRDAYTARLFRVSTEGAWQEWIAFFLEAILHASEQAARQVDGLIALHAEWQGRFQSARSSALLLKLVDALFKRPAITIGGAAKLLRVTPASASANLAKLERAGIVAEVTGRTRNRIYVARELLRFMGGGGERR